MNKLYRLDFKIFKPLLAALFLPGFMVACATTPSADREPVSVEDRAQARWDHLIRGEVAQAYNYLSPGYRSSVPLSAYQSMIAQKKVGWTAASPVGSDCTGTTCKVRVMLNYRLVGALPGVKSFDGKQLVTESWVNSDGQWWHIPPN